MSTVQLELCFTAHKGVTVHQAAKDAVQAMKNINALGAYFIFNDTPIYFDYKTSADEIVEKWLNAREQPRY